MPLDDDPLTSPSFPAINTSDSRSYRTRRPGSQHAGSQQDSGQDRGPAGDSQPGGISQPAPVSRPAHQFPAPAVPDRSASAPNGYPVQAPVAPAANPYGSFVNTPQAGYTDATTGHLDGSAYGPGYADPGQPAVPDASWYPADNGNGNGYYDTSYNGTAPSGTGAGDAGYAGNG